MTLALDLLGGPYDTVFDVGGNVGDFAEAAHALWPQALITSFEPVPELAAANWKRSAGRWQVNDVAISDRSGDATMLVCTNQHSASTLQEPGNVRRREFGIVDQFQPTFVRTERLDWFDRVGAGRLLIKIDVEGHEGQVLVGARSVLSRAATVVCEVQNDPDIFLGSPAPSAVDKILRHCGLHFAGLLDSFASPGGRVLQFDGIWKRYEGES